MNEREEGIIRVIDDIVHDKFAHKGERIWRFIKQCEMSEKGCNQDSPQRYIEK